MSSHETPARSRRITNPLTVALLGVLVGACAAEEPMTGTWRDPDAQTPLPATIDPMMRPLNIDATLELDDSASPGTFNLFMDLEALGLTDSIEAEGTFIADGAELELIITGFVIDPASGNTSSVGEDGAQCIVLEGFAGTPVCFAAPQGNAYTYAGDMLTLTLEHEIAGEPSETTFGFERVQP